MDRSRLNRFINQPLRELPLEVPVIVAPGDSVRVALDRMQADSGSCVLVQESARVTGIFTERDVLRRCMADGFDWQQPVANVVTNEPRTIGLGRTLAEAIATFQQFGYRTLPVVDDGAVVGLIRVGDVLRHIAEAFPEEVLNLPPRPHQVAERQEGG